MKSKYIFFASCTLFLLFAACEPLQTPTPKAPAPQSENNKQSPPAVAPKVDYTKALLTERPYPRQYCFTPATFGPLTAPEGFLYLPFKGALSDNTWSSQMDHDRPNYTRNGKLATLGATGQYDRHDAEFTGGTQAYINSTRSYQIFDYQTPIQALENQGFFILAYQLPGAEMISTKETYWSYYDGHDGQDFYLSEVLKGPVDALAAGDGTVLLKGNYGDTLGNVVEIFHPQGYVTRYAHLASFAEGLTVGKNIKAGQPVGTIGGSAVVNGKLNLNYWGPHLHFSVFRWNSETGAWAITDPFGWDPWAGPDEAARTRAQQRDPLAQCNGEYSYDLWADNWPHNVGEAVASQPFMPGRDRYVGGYYYGEQAVQAITDTPIVPTITPIIPTVTPSIIPTPTHTPTPIPVAPDYNIAYVYQGNIYLAKTDGSQVTSTQSYTQDPAGGNVYPAWSPDGRYLLYTHFDMDAPTLRILDVWTGQTVQEIPSACCGAWNPNTGDIAYVRTDQGVVVSAAPDNSRTTVLWTLFPGRSAFGRGAWAPDGTLYLALSQGESATQVWGIRDGQAEQVIGPGGYDADSSNVMTSPAVSRDGTLSVTIHTEYLPVAPGGPHTFFGYAGVTAGGFGRWMGDLGFGDNASWSPDGQQILWEQWVGCEEVGISAPGYCMGGLGIRSVNFNEGTLIQRGEEYLQPAWKP